MNRGRGTAPALSPDASPDDSGPTSGYTGAWKGASMADWYALEKLRANAETGPPGATLIRRVKRYRWAEKPYDSSRQVLRVLHFVDGSFRMLPRVPVSQFGNRSRFPKPGDVAVLFLDEDGQVADSVCFRLTYAAKALGVKVPELKKQLAPDAPGLTAELEAALVDVAKRLV